MITKIAVITFVYLGVFLMFIASVGLFRMPDIYTRMSAVTKAVTFKVGLVMLSVIIYFNTFPAVVKALLVVFLLMLTTPVSSHLLGRETYMRKASLWEKTIIDELKKYLETKDKKEK